MTTLPLQVHPLRLRFMPPAGLHLFALLFGASTVSCADSTPVPLAFGWTPTIEARVEVWHSRVRQAVQSDTQRSALRYTMHVQEHPDGLLITYDDFALGPSPDGHPSHGPRPALSKSGSPRVEMLSGLMPSFVVTNDGEFVRLDDLDGLKDRNLQAIRDSLTTPEEERLLRDMLTDDAMTSIVAQEWTAIVDFWAGRQLVPRRTVETTGVGSLPLIPTITVAMTYKVTLKRWLPCSEDEREKRCVELELYSYPNSAQVARALHSLLESVAVAATPDQATAVVSAIPAFRSMDVENLITLITEPGTLLPHELQINRLTTGTMSIEGESIPVRLLDQRAYRFEYLRR